MELLNSCLTPGQWEQGIVFYSPAGTVHAIGAGISLLEVQQNADITYRPYDYGRDRELHIDEAIAAARLCPAEGKEAPVLLDQRRERIAGGRAFQVERIKGPARGQLIAPNGGLWAVILNGASSMSGGVWQTPSCWRLESVSDVEVAANTTLILAYCGSETKPVWTMH